MHYFWSGPVNPNWGPGSVNINWGPGLEVRDRAGGQAKGRESGNTKALIIKLLILSDFGAH